MTSTAAERPEETFRQWVAGEVRAHLARARMSQRALARQLGVTPPWVNERLSGRYAMSTDDLQAIADVLGTTPMNLLSGQSRPPGPGSPTPPPAVGDTPLAQSSSSKSTAGDELATRRCRRSAVLPAAAHVDMARSA